MLTLIAAHDSNYAIGKSGDIPWSAPEDLKFFNRETTGSAVIMGRRTWESIGANPLPRRLNIVVSSTETEASLTVSTIEAALIAAREAGHARVYGIGGSGIYRALLPLADRLLLTHVNLEVALPDTFFPKFDTNQWVLNQSFELRSAPPVCTLNEFLKIK